MSNLKSTAPFSQNKKTNITFEDQIKLRYSRKDKIEMEFRRNYNDSRKPYNNKLCARQSNKNTSIIWINNIMQDNYCNLKKGFTTPDPKQRED
jgi:hypothetical protein